MSFDLLAALYVWCSYHHTGQWSREYRIMSRIAKRGISLSDNAWEAIKDGTGRAAEEWSYSHELYKRLCDKHSPRPFRY